ncbi:MAG: type II toxin-antitoxin system RelE/ParE family toxin [Spirochaetales bacterium]|nr:type II toxin-antitoxin system RelE/ParE family toxin [Spirochaetales bacterium]
MTYNLLIERRAQKELGKLPGAAYPQMIAALRRLGEDARPAGAKKLQGRQGWRIRIGDYRVIYEIDEGRKLVRIVDVGHRKDIYR